MAERLASTRTKPRTPRACSASSRAICSALASMRRVWCSSVSPAGVRRMPRGSRTSRVQPSACSSSASRLLTADGAMAARRAAPLSVPS